MVAKRRGWRGGEGGCASLVWLGQSRLSVLSVLAEPTVPGLIFAAPRQRPVSHDKLTTQQSKCVTHGKWTCWDSTDSLLDGRR